MRFSILKNSVNLELEKFRKLYEKLASDARSGIQKGVKDTGTPDCAKSNSIGSPNHAMCLPNGKARASVG